MNIRYRAVWVALLAGITTFSAHAADPTYPRNVSDEVNLHLIVVDSEGRPRKPVVMETAPADPAHGVEAKYDIQLPRFVDDDLSKDPFAAAQKENRLYHDYLNLMFQNVKTSKKNKILVVIHGGMNFIKGAVSRACESYETIQNGSDYYPIFVCWDSNPLSTYWDGLVFNREGEYHRQFPQLLYGIFTTPLCLVGDIGGAVSRGPEIFANQTYGDLQTVIPGAFSEPQRANERIPYMDDRNSNGILGVVGAKAATPPVGSKGTRAGIVSSVGQRKKAPYENTLRTASYVATLPAKIVTAPVLDSMGNRAWNQMSARVQMMFRCDTEYNFDDIAEDSTAANHPEWAYSGGYAPPRGAVAVFIRSLTRFQAKARAQHAPFYELNDPYYDSKHPWNSYLDVTLIGHSMGAMVINEIARYCNEQEDCWDTDELKPKTDLPSEEASNVQADYLHVRNVVFFAAACTVREFESFTVPFIGRRIHRGEPIDFYNLSLHPQAELRETNAFDLVPRGSLLVWIDNYFSDPRTYYDKTFGNFNTSVLSAQIIPPLLRKYTHFKAFKVGNDVTPPVLPQKHGDFLLMPNEENKLTPYWTHDFWQPQGPPK